MRKVVHKWFFAWDYEKEEKWLKEMSVKGLALVDVGFCKYVFEPCEPGEYTYCLELLEHNPRSAESESYICFVENTGAEHVATFARWAYFRKKSAAGEFELFSDNSSRIKHFNRMLVFFALLGGYELYAGIYNLGVYLLNGMVIGLISSLLLFSFVLLFGIAIIKMLIKRRKLRKEQQIFED